MMNMYCAYIMRNVVVLVYKAMTCNISFLSPALMHLLVTHLKLLPLKCMEDGHAPAVKLAG